MEKNISINISGIIFHVEEDGYELLKNYLESISRYFSTYEDSKEITDDIESRIAEIFLSKLSSGKQVITREDVEGVVKTMGSVEDFAAAEVLEEESTYRANYSQAKQDYTESEDETYGRKRLYRDTERKVLGGVAAGIAHYFKTDPLWVRLLFLIFFFADAFASFGTISLVAYIVLWIVVPGSTVLSPDQKVKKLFRNPDDKVIGGVSGGIGAYFGTDTTAVRLLFVLSIFLGGTGLLIYLVLWLITPEAQTLTDKMQMKGEPVTLSNIESSIKKNFSVDESGEESLLLKIILFPFRIIAVVIDALSKALGPLLNVVGDLARVLAGLILVLIGGVIIFAIIVASSVLLGLTSIDPVALVDGEVPLRLLQESLPATASIFGAITILIPAAALILSGIAIITRRKIMNSTIGWSALGLWFIALIGVSVTIPQVVLDFKEEGNYTTTETFDLDNNMVVLTLGDYPDDQSFAKPRLVIRGHADSTVELRKDFEARGRNRKAAIEYAQMVSYDIIQDDSILIFPPTFTYQGDAKFRDQEVDLTLYIPFRQVFMMDRQLGLILRNTLYRDGYRASDMDDNTFIFTEDGLECTSCLDKKNLDEQLGSDRGGRLESAPKSEFQSYEMGEFNKLDIEGPFRVSVTRGDDFQVRINGNRKSLDDVQVVNDAGTLEVYLSKNINFNTDNLLEVTLTLEEIKDLRLSGTSQINMSGIDTEAFNVELSGSSKGFLELETSRISINMGGASNLKLFGRSKQLYANLSGAAQLEALEMPVQTASLETSGAVKAQLDVGQELNADAEDTSRIQYRGNPKLNLSGSSSDRVKQIE